MVRTDQCGCVIDSKYASDYLVRRLYSGGRGKEVCYVKVDGARWFRLYRDSGVVTYRSSECPVLVMYSRSPLKRSRKIYFHTDLGSSSQCWLPGDGSCEETRAHEC